MVFPVGDVEFHVAVLAEVSLQPRRLVANLVQDTKHQLFSGHGSREYADTLLVGYTRVSSGLDQCITQSGVTSNVCQQKS